MIFQEKPHFLGKVFLDAPAGFFQFGQAPVADSSHPCNLILMCVIVVLMSTYLTRLQASKGQSHACFIRSTAPLLRKCQHIGGHEILLNEWRNKPCRNYGIVLFFIHEISF